MSWCSRIPLDPVLGCLSWILATTAGRQTVVCHCAVAVLWFSRATVATCPLAVKKVAAIFFLAPLDLPQSLGNTHTYAFFQDHAGRSRIFFRHVCHAPRVATLDSMRHPFAPFHPCQLLSFCQIVWHPVKSKFSQAREGGGYEESS